MVDRESVYLAGYQSEPGGETIPVGFSPVPVDDVDYTSDLEDAHRVLFMVEGSDGGTHWYWMIDGVTDPDDAYARIEDLDASGDYGELG